MLIMVDFRLPAPLQNVTPWVTPAAPDEMKTGEPMWMQTEDPPEERTLLIGSVQTGECEEIPADWNNEKLKDIIPNGADRTRALQWAFDRKCTTFEMEDPAVLRILEPPTTKAEFEASRPEGKMILAKFLLCSMLTPNWGIKSSLERGDRRCRGSLACRVWSKWSLSSAAAAIAARTSN